MPILQSAFRPPAFLRNGHLQTILPVLLPRKHQLTYRRERLELPDGDYLDLDWSAAGNRRVVVLSHGLEGASEAGYIRGMAATLLKQGWDILAWNFRSCGGEANRLLRFYHSGETRDLATVVEQAARRYPMIALAGFSLGGNVTLKYLGEAAPHPAIVSAVAISTPIDLASSAKALQERRGNEIYLRRFLKTLVLKIEAKAARFPDQLDASNARKLRTLEDFDDRYTAPLHGFRDANDYWKRSSSRQFLPQITVPTLLLNAQDDPFLTPASLPIPEAEASPSFFLEMPKSGGHVGFLDLKSGIQPYSERRASKFLKSHR